MPSPLIGCFYIALAYLCNHGGSFWQSVSYETEVNSVGLVHQGMGKTVELLACILAHPFPGPAVPAELVCPLALFAFSMHHMHTRLLTVIVPSGSR